MAQTTENEKKLVCPSCGGHIVYDAEAQQFRCASCGAVQEIAPQKEAVEEYDFAGYRSREGEHMLEGGELTMVCPACGSEILLPANETATVCPMCGSPQLRPGSTDTGIPVEGVIPFAVDRFEAQKVFGAWIRKRWFAPNALKKLFSEGNLQGVYVPFWTYDVDASAFYSGQGGEDRTRTDSEGNTETYTDWYAVSGHVSNTYDDIQVCASKTFRSGLIENVLPYDSVRGTRPYQPQYLSGYKAERYTVDGIEAFEDAKRTVESDLRSRAHDDIVSGGYDRAQVDMLSVSYHDVRYKHILVPLWTAQYGYRNKTYRYLINGESGRVSAEYPKSPVKIALTVLLVILILVGIFKLIGGSDAEAATLPADLSFERISTVESVGEAETDALSDSAVNDCAEPRGA